MPKFFPGVTHHIVRTPKNAENMTRMGGAIAIVYLCFGSDEDNILVQIKKMDGPTAGVTAISPSFVATSDSKNILIPAVQGKVANELKLSALIAFDQVKQKFGLKFGKKYKILAQSVEEIGATDAVSSSGVGQ